MLRTLFALLFVSLMVGEARAAFTSLHIFGDGITTTTNGPGGAFYHGKRFTNGRVWAEVLAERQGIAFDHTRNWSYFGHYSPNLLTNLNQFVAPPDAATALFVVWVVHADFVSYLANSAFSPYNATRLGVWTNALNQSLSNHVAAMEKLHQKGARSLVLPTAADLTKVPYYGGLPAADRAFIRARVMDFNAGLRQRVAQARVTWPDLVVHVPDVFTLLDDVIARPAHYQLVNALENGRPVDALSDFSLSDKSLAGPGASYIYWDYLDPTARAHAIIADLSHEVVSPPRIASWVLEPPNLRLELINLPIGLAGFVDGTEAWDGWTPAGQITGAGATQSVTLPTESTAGFFRLRFPNAWTWP